MEDFDDEVILFGEKKRKKRKKAKKSKDLTWVFVIGIIVLAIVIAFVMNYKTIFTQRPDAGEDMVSVMVNQNPIPNHALERKYDLFLRAIQYSGAPEDAPVTKERFLNESLITHILLLEEALKNRIDVDDFQIDEMIMELELQAGGPDALSVLLEAQGLTMTELREQLREKMTVEGLLNLWFSEDNATVSNDELRAFYDSSELGDVTFDEIKDQLRAAILQNKRQQIFENRLQELMENADIMYYFGEDSQEDFTGDCVRSYGIGDATMIYYYDAECEHCQVMGPVVDNLGDEFTFFRADNSDTNNVVAICLNGFIADGVPQFICAGSRERKVGTLFEESLRKFAKGCV